jgi:hypothetical protein
MFAYWFQLFWLTHEGASSVPSFVQREQLNGAPLSVQCSFATEVMSAIRAEFRRLQRAALQARG